MSENTLDVPDAPAPLAAGKRELTKAANRQAILNAARQVFSELGYGETTVRDIIRRTGLAAGTFYNYFRSKEEVFEALMDDNALRARPGLREARLKAATFRDFISECFRAFFTFVASDQLDYAMLRRNTGTIRVRMDTPEIVAGFEELEQDLAQAIARGLAPPVDVDYLAGAFIGVAFEIGDRLVLRPRPDIEEATAFATELFMGGIDALPRREAPGAA